MHDQRSVGCSQNDLTKQHRNQALHNPPRRWTGGPSRSCLSQHKPSMIARATFGERNYDFHTCSVEAPRRGMTPGVLPASFEQHDTQLNTNQTRSGHNWPSGRPSALATYTTGVESDSHRWRLHRSILWLRSFPDPLHGSRLGSTSLATASRSSCISYNLGAPLCPCLLGCFRP